MDQYLAEVSEYSDCHDGLPRLSISIRQVRWDVSLLIKQIMKLPLRVVTFWQISGG